MSCLDKDLGNHTRGIIRVEEETIDTVALPQSADLPPQSLLTLTKRL